MSKRMRRQLINGTAKLAWLFPSTFYLHGERGNILAFNKLAPNLGLNLRVSKVELHKDFRPLDYDLIYCPAGEITHFDAVINGLKDVRDELNEFIELGRPLIVTGNSISLFGDKIIRANGDVIKGLGLTKLISNENNSIYGDDIFFRTNYNNHELELIGNQIQMSDMTLEGESPFGELLYGYGNNGKDTNEGLIKNNSIFTNALGPLFALNPWLTQEVLNVIRINKNLDPITDELDYSLERKSFDAKKKYIQNKKTNLKNIK